VYSQAALTLAWTQDGGQVLGLAPSAAAAAVLAEQTEIRADTLAKLTWSLRQGDLPDWAAAVGPSTLVIIDEAGMADTLPSTRPCSSPSDGVPVSGWSVMINNSPRSAPAVSSATSDKPTARCIWPSCTASPTPPKQQHHSPSAKANLRHSPSTSITVASTSATSRPPPNMPSPPGS
jgi:hypothetical protein